ncbi:MAG: shikimate kinase AroK [Pseudomonadota bacterium]
MSQNIFLIGPMGAGKTTVGRRLAALCGLRFVDSDQAIEERTGVDIPLIFEKEGESGFRRREAQILDELTAQTDVVIATGGGAILDADTRARLKARGFVVFLNAGLEQQLSRTRRTSHRPLLKTGDRRETLTRLFAIREPLYREAAHLELSTTGRNAQVLAALIAAQRQQIETA